jgi:NAD(P)-dependent dehydrogenase (short-subunit alcohol dehydrogenase family)
MSSAGPSPTAVITGAARGIGLALAEALADRGHRLVLGDVDAASLRAEAERLGADAAVTTDVADPESMDRLAAVARTPDLLCLNAGVISVDGGAPWESGPEEWDRVLGVNLGGVVNGLRTFVPPMLERSTPSSILITASLAGLLTWPGGGPYAASKHAVTAVAEQAAMAPTGTVLSVTVLCPALVRTGMSDEGDDPAEVARLALEAVDQRRFSVVPGEWVAALQERAVTIATGRRPTTPEPGATPPPPAR